MRTVLIPTALMLMACGDETTAPVAAAEERRAATDEAAGGTTARANLQTGTVSTSGGGPITVNGQRIEITDAGQRFPAQSASFGEGGTVAVGTGFVRPAAAGAQATAAYVNLLASDGGRLVAVEAPGFRAVELHETVREDGVMRMRQLDGVDLPANEVVRFAPGGTHVMLIGPEAGLAEGDRVSLTFRFESGVSVTLPVPVERR